MAREDQAKGAGAQAISPLVALLTGEADAQEASLDALSIEEEPTRSNQGLQDDASSSGELDEPSRSPRSDDLTEAGMIVGTPMYMAPEISFGSRHAQPPSDVFALGVIAYELLTTELPFKRPALGTVLRHETLVMPTGLRTRTTLDPALLELFERSLSMDPAQRPTAAELAAALLLDPATPFVLHTDD